MYFKNNKNLMYQVQQVYKWKHIKDEPLILFKKGDV